MPRRPDFPAGGRDLGAAKVQALVSRFRSAGRVRAKLHRYGRRRDGRSRTTDLEQTGETTRHVDCRSKRIEEDIENAQHGVQRESAVADPIPDVARKIEVKIPELARVELEEIASKEGVVLARHRAHLLALFFRREVNRAPSDDFVE